MTGPDRPQLRRLPAGAPGFGVCAGLARRLDVDPVLVRLALVLAVLVSGGAALIAYLVAGLVIPAEGTRPPASAADPPGRPRRGRNGEWKVAAGAGLLMLSALLVLRELGIWWSDAVIWPLILASFGAVLLWRISRPPAPAADGGAPPSLGGEVQRAQRRRAANLYRGGFGIALVVGAVLLFLSANGVLDAPREAVLATISGVAALGLILAPFLWGLGRNLADERAERIRSQERAELAAHVHDSVLQTLTLMQKRAGDPRAVAALARRQERELRGWLFDRDRDRDGEGLAAALERVAAEVEDAHGVAVELVAVGDRPLDAPGQALTAAAGEAITNAAKFAADAGPIAVYAELASGRAQVFVRDRGGGFDAGAVPPDRRGLRESIIGRMERNGGRATVRSSPGEGTEVELAIGEGG